MVCTCPKDAFQANGEPTGENLLVRIIGDCNCPSARIRLSLEPANPGINPQENEICLQLVEHGDGPVEVAPVSTPVEYMQVVEMKAEWVSIRHDGQDLRFPIRWPGGLIS